MKIYQIYQIFPKKYHIINTNGNFFFTSYNFWFQLDGNGYAFGYQVNEPISGSFYQQEESSNGDKTVGDIDHSL